MAKNNRQLNEIIMPIDANMWDKASDDATNAQTNFTSVLNNLNDKVDKVSGKGLSTNDFTATDKNKLDAIYTNTFQTTVSTSWTGSGPYTQTVTVNGILASDNPIVDIVLSNTLATAKSQAIEWVKVSKITTENNSITIRCDNEKPIIQLPIQLKVVR